MTSPFSANQFEPRVHVRNPGAWQQFNDNALDTTGIEVITEGLLSGGTQIESGWVRIINRSTSGNLLFGPTTALAVPGVPPATTQDILSATSSIVVYVGVNGTLWIKASTGTVRATVQAL